MSADYNSSAASFLFSPDFFGQFERESDKKYLYIENNQVFTDECVHQSRNKAFERWLNSAQKNNEDDFHIPYTFQQIATRLSKSKTTTNRKNADLREFQVFKNCFLVKKFFTTGFKRVKPNELHVLTTTNRNLDLFIPKSEMNLDDGAFEAKTDYLYDKYCLTKHTRFTFSPGQEYMIISPSKCIFLFEKQEAADADSPQEN